jgi:flavin-dependent dehydrogenase
LASAFKQDDTLNASAQPAMYRISQQPVGPGWALAGDAACHKDPIHRAGVCDALRDAELLADAAPRGTVGQAANQSGHGEICAGA